MAECSACGTAEEMLFVCRYCEGKFCAAHVREHGCGDGGSGVAGQRAQAAVGGSAGTAEAEAGAATAAASTAVGRDRQAGGDDGAAPVRPMDAREPPGATTRRRPETVAGWLRQQTYLTLAVKVGGLALLVSLAFYAGLAFALYDPMGLL